MAFSEVVSNMELCKYQVSMALSKDTSEGSVRVSSRVKKFGHALATFTATLLSKTGDNRGPKTPNPKA